LDVGSPGDAVGFGAGGGDILIEAGQWGVESTGEPEGAKDEGALGVIDVSRNLADRPLAGRVAVQRFLVGDARPGGKGFLELGLEAGADIAGGDAVDVAVVIGRGFRGFGAAGHANTLAETRRGGSASQNQGVRDEISRNGSDRAGG